MQYGSSVFASLQWNEIIKDFLAYFFNIHILNPKVALHNLYLFIYLFLMLSQMTPWFEMRLNDLCLKKEKCEVAPKLCGCIQINFMLENKAHLS